MFNKIGFIGLGLIGGSLAKTIKRHHPQIILKAYDIDETNLQEAMSLETIDEIANDISKLTDCSLIFLGTPIDISLKYIEKIHSFGNFHGIITDVGSVKSPICSAVDGLDLPIDFIGGHPMAGSEKTGFVNAKENLFENVYYFLTPIKNTNTIAVGKLSEFLSSISILPVVLSHQDHDKIVASISHLPHIVATSLVNMIRKLDKYDYLKRFCAGGFKDITRISSSSPQLWSNICRENKTYLLECIDEYIGELNDFKTYLKKDDDTTEVFEDAKNYRDRLPKASNGLIAPTFIIYCDLDDEAGAIAKMANHLYMNDISIKNIAIENSREFFEGALRIELYDEKAYILAKKVLTKYEYTIFR